MAIFIHVEFIVRSGQWPMAPGRAGHDREDVRRACECRRLIAETTHGGIRLQIRFRCVPARD
jgi:hypothetical protein